MTMVKNVKEGTLPQLWADVFPCECTRTGIRAMHCVYCATHHGRRPQFAGLDGRPAPPIGMNPSAESPHDVLRSYPQEHTASYLCPPSGEASPLWTASSGSSIPGSPCSSGTAIPSSSFHSGSTTIPDTTLSSRHTVTTHSVIHMQLSASSEDKVASSDQRQIPENPERARWEQISRSNIKRMMVLNASILHQDFISLCKRYGEQKAATNKQNNNDISRLASLFFLRCFLGYILAGGSIRRINGQVLPTDEELSIRVIQEASNWRTDPRGNEEPSQKLRKKANGNNRPAIISKRGRQSRSKA